MIEGLWTNKCLRELEMRDVTSEHALLLRETNWVQTYVCCQAVAEFKIQTFTFCNTFLFLIFQSTKQFKKRLNELWTNSWQVFLDLTQMGHMGTGIVTLTHCVQMSWWYSKIRIPQSEASNGRSWPMRGHNQDNSTNIPRVMLSIQSNYEIYHQRINRHLPLFIRCHW